MLGTRVSHAPVKHCPKCNRQYDDYTLRFCLEDGSVLSASSNQPATVVMDRAALPSVTAPVTAPAQVFISYKRNSPDEKLAQQICEALGVKHRVFIDRTMKVGTRWASRIEAELRQSDFLIVFLSVQSVNSEMVWGEIKMAHRLAKEQGGRPAILPVRLDFTGPFPYPLSTILDEIQWLEWDSSRDPKELIDELTLVIAGEARANDSLRLTNTVEYNARTDFLEPPPPQAQPFCEMPEGTMDPDSDFYVTRQSDGTALDAIKRSGVTITIKGPRQMGKSSLLMRTLEAGRNMGKKILFLDFQQLDAEALTDANAFFWNFCCWLTDELDMANRVDEYWKRYNLNIRRCTKYVGEYLLPEIDSPVMLAIDEADSIFGASFRSEFFGMLRSWHNNRATGNLSKERGVWKKLDLILVTSTEPYQLIENLNQSPFNVGEKIELEDFDEDQSRDLNLRHCSPFTEPELARLLQLVNGHPYLLRRALYLVATQQLSVSDLFVNAIQDRGPFGDHLRYHILRIYKNKELVQGLLEVIRRNRCPDEQLFFRLQGAGLVRRGTQKGRVVPRCQLYAEYFREHLYD